MEHVTKNYVEIIIFNGEKLTMKWQWVQMSYVSLPEGMTCRSLEMHVDQFRGHMPLTMILFDLANKS